MKLKRNAYLFILKDSQFEISILRCHFFLRLLLQGTEEGTKDGAVEHNTGDDEESSAPPKERNEPLGERGEDEGAQSRAAHRDPRRQRAQLLEVTRHTDNRGQVDQAETKTCEQRRYCSFISMLFMLFLLLSTWQFEPYSKQYKSKNIKAGK